MAVQRACDGHGEARVTARILVGSHKGLDIFNPETGALTPWRAIDPESPGNRGNDGACDAMGRFWFGTMMNNIGPMGEDLPITASTGKLFRIDADGTATVMETGDRRFQRPLLVARRADLLFHGFDGAGDLGL